MENREGPVVWRCVFTDRHARGTVRTYLIRWVWIVVWPAHVQEFPFDLGTSQWVQVPHATWSTSTFYYSSLMVHGSRMENYLQCCWLWFASAPTDSLLPLHVAEMQMVQTQTKPLSHLFPPPSSLLPCVCSSSFPLTHYSDHCVVSSLGKM